MIDLLGVIDSAIDRALALTGLGLDSGILVMREVGDCTSEPELDLDFDPSWSPRMTRPENVTENVTDFTPITHTQRTSVCITPAHSLTYAVTCAYMYAETH